MSASRDPSPVLEALGHAISVRRKGLGLSQEQLAHRAGLNRTYITDIERGVRNIAFLNLAKVARALEVPVSELVQGIDQTPSSSEDVRKVNHGSGAVNA